MESYLKHSVWAVALRGIVAVLFGIAILIWPAITLKALLLAFALYVLIEGAATIFATIRNHRQTELWPLTIILGILGVIAGLYLLANPAVTGVTLLFIIAAYNIARGITDIVLGILLRNEIRGEWLLILSGMVSLVFGVAIFANPLVGALAILWIIALSQIISGTVLIGAAFALDSLK